MSIKKEKCFFRRINQYIINEDDAEDLLNLSEHIWIDDIFLIAIKMQYICMMQFDWYCIIM